MKLIVGLGNPDLKYLTTKHNTGFMTIDSLLKKIGGLTLDDTKFNGCFTKTKIENEDCIVAKPMTYMNLSGEFIRPLADFYKINYEDIIVCHDELALNEGRIKICTDGSAAGHNGIKNIILNLGTEKFIRVRIGIGPLPQGVNIMNYVMFRWDKDSLLKMRENLDKASDAVIDIIKNGVSHAENMYNKKE